MIRPPPGGADERADLEVPETSCKDPAADLRLGNTGFVLYPYGATDFNRHHQLNLRLGYRIPLGKR